MKKRLVLFSFCLLAHCGAAMAQSGGPIMGTGETFDSPRNQYFHFCPSGSKEIGNLKCRVNRATYMTGTLGAPVSPCLAVNAEKDLTMQDPEPVSRRR